MIQILPKTSFVNYTFAFVALWSTIAKFCLYSSEKSGVYVYALFIVLSLLGQMKDKFIDLHNRKYALIILASFFFLYGVSFFINEAPMGNADFLMLYFLLMFVLSKDKYKRESVDLFVKWLTILLLLGLVEYFSFIFFQKYIDLGVVDRDEELTQSFFHGGFCLFRIELSVFRFQGLAEEPGLLGTLCGFLIFLVSNKKEYKISNIVFWISGLLTFSFAFYVLAIINLCRKLTNIKFLFIILLSSFVFYSLFQEYFDDFVIGRFDRFEYGDNRSAETLDIAMAKSFDDGSILLGHGKESHNLLNLEKGVAGAKVWVYQYGLFCFVAIFYAYSFYYFSMCKKNNLRMGEVFLFFLAFWLSFYQRQYIEHPYNVIVFFSSPILLSFKNN